MTPGTSGRPAWGQRAGGLLLCAVFSLAATASAAIPPAAPALRGRVLLPDGAPAVATFVSAQDQGGVVTTTVLTDEAGVFRFTALAAGSYQLRAHRPGLRSPSIEVALPLREEPTLRLELRPNALREVPSSALLAVLPDGEAKRRFVLDCTGCHPFTSDVAAPTGTPREQDDWVFWIERMLSFAGQGTGFPIIGERDPEETAAWLSRHLGAPGALPEAPALPVGGDGPVITEYALPLATDLPHDLALDSAGGVVVTGMMSHRLYTLAPGSGTWNVVAIPVETANPRAVEVGPDGRWWVALGSPGRVAARDPETGAWASWEIGVYPHDVVVAPDGSVWANGHFSVAPEVVKRVDPASGAVRTVELPGDPMPYGGSRIPYGFRAGLGGDLWMTELLGNRLIRVGADGTLRGSWQLPTPRSGPRRLDVDATGTVWIPEYAAGRLARFDPEAGSFQEVDYPTPDALPYIARVDPREGTVWVATGASNTLARWDPAGRCWLEVPLPHRAALVRHIAVDAATGDVWGAYAPSPPTRPAVFRVRVPDRSGC